MSATPESKPALTAELAATVQAYRAHAQAYSSDNAEKMGAEVATFAQGLPAGAWVLDAGCGPGRDLRRFRELGLFPVGVDITPEFVLEASKHAWASVGDLRALNFKDGVFAAVWACASLVHFTPTDAQIALREFRRVSAPGARLRASVKNSGITGWVESPHGTRWFYRWANDEFASTVESSGWELTSVATTGPFVEVDALRA